MQLNLNLLEKKSRTLKYLNLWRWDERDQPKWCLFYIPWMNLSWFWESSEEHVAFLGRCVRRIIIIITTMIIISLITTMIIIMIILIIMSIIVILIIIIIIMSIIIKSSNDVKQCIVQPKIRKGPSLFPSLSLSLFLSLDLYLSPPHKHTLLLLLLTNIIERVT